ncbi:MAG: glycosyltransferase [Myxococcales bacterium]|nr:glycosyltransferase [Myxococcales bacterium]
MLIATRDREQLLRTRSLPSALSQTYRPGVVVIVNDGAPFELDVLRGLLKAADDAGVQLTVIENERAKGAAGAWNSGLVHLARVGHHGFVAILDDDDEWDDVHLDINVENSTNANVVVSGLRMCDRGILVTRPHVEALSDRHFLTGNPGWQGSNTFVSLDLLLDVGGFRDGLASMNDRDLAIRLLRHPHASWRLTGQWTATWHRDTPGSLSTPLSEAKLSGLRRFWRIYGSEMSRAEETKYFDRAVRLFSFGRHDIVETAANDAVAELPHGSLHG